MKKYLAIFMALVLALSCMVIFSACGDNNCADGETAAPTDAADSIAATEAGTTAPDEGEKPVLKMGTNAYFQPYEFYEGEKIVGIDAEIAAAIAEKLGMTLEIVDMEFDSILTAVNEGSVDFGMAGMTITDDRLLEVDFSISYANGVQAIIVKEDSPITSVDDLYAEGASYKVGVQLGTTGDVYATDDFGSDNVTTYSNGNEAVLALAGGSVDCVIIDNEPAKALVAANSGLKILETEYANEDYAICVKKGNSELLDKINAAILELTEDGTIEGIVAKYIK
ncbi:MAG: transporter substrate-binding domain-containing protein [Ruminococcaceae bacterium]|nr:transporter substrate-binding domain-containing protein [Oscillospiraceae bacterium]